MNPAALACWALVGHAGLPAGPDTKAATPHAAPTPPPPMMPSIAKAQATQARRTALTDAVHHADAAVRLHAAALLGEDSSAHGVLLLYLLAHDLRDEVQAAALAATTRRCAAEKASVCAAMMKFFVDDVEDSQTRWQARDWLLHDDPEAATRTASTAYKLDVVARMAERADRPDGAGDVLHTLRLLAEDPEPEVQEAASAVLLRAKL